MYGNNGQHPVRWQRSTLTTAYLVAVTAFTGPGVFGALNGLGAGGGAKPEISNAANAVSFALLAVGSLFVGGIVNRMQPKYALMIGSMAYTPYAAGLYMNDRYGSNWLLLAGATFMGIFGSFYWVATGAILMGYLEENRKGTGMSLRFAFMTLGSSIGGIISLVLNAHRNYRGSVSRSTYIVMMILMSIGWPFALLVPTSKKVERTDGRKVVLQRQANFSKEFKVLKAILKQPVVWALFPLMLYSQFFLSYVWQYNFAYFTVRSRALNSTMSYLLGLVCSLITGAFLDCSRWSRKTRARWGFAVLVIITGGSWIITQIVQIHYDKTKPTMDWSDDSYGLGAFVFALLGASDPLMTTYMFWLIGSLSNDVNEQTFLAAIASSTASFGSAMGFVVSAKKVSYVVSCALNLIVFWIAVPSLAWVVFTKVDNTSHGKHLTPFSADQQGELRSAAESSKEEIVVEYLEMK